MNLKHLLLKGRCFFVGNEKKMNALTIKERKKSNEGKRILIGKISGIEDKYHKLKNEKIIKAQ